MKKFALIFLLAPTFTFAMMRPRLDINSWSVDQRSSNQTLQTDYLKVQVYFLKQLLNVSTKNDDQKIAAFDQALINIEQSYQNRKTQPTEINIFGAGHELLPSVAEAYIKKATESSYHRLSEEQLYSQGPFSHEVDFNKFITSWNLPDDVRSGYLTLQDEGTSVFINDDSNNYEATKNLKKLTQKFLEFDFEIPSYLAIPNISEAMTRKEMNRLMEEEVKRIQKILNEKAVKEFEAVPAHNRSFAKQVEIQKKYQQIGNSELAIFANNLNYSAPQIVDELFKNSKFLFFRDLVGYRPEEKYLVNYRPGDAAYPDADARMKLIKLARKDKLKIINGITNKFEQYNHKLEHISEELIRSKELAFTNASDQRFFELLISTYYSDISEETKRDILKTLIEKPYQDSGLELFKLLVLHSGPQMQKFLQILGQTDGFSDKLKKIFSLVEDSGLQTPWETAKSKFSRPPKGYEWVSFDTQPMVGSMAQSYKAIAKDKNGNMVSIAARVLKDNIKTKLNNENSKLEKMAQLIDNDPMLRSAGFPLIQPILGDVKLMATEETEVPLTKKNQLMGTQKYDSSVRLKSGMQIDFVTPITLDSEHSDVLYSTWLEGVKFEEFQKNNPKEAQLVAKAIAQKWVDVAFFNGTFFHADLHQGNMKIQKLGAQHMQVGFLDFGMADTLSTVDRSTMARLGIELRTMKAAKLIAEYIWSLSDGSLNSMSKAELIDKIIIKQKSESSSDVSTWLKWSMSEGIKLKKNISSFSRGLSAIEQLLHAAKSDTQMSDLIIGVAKGYKWDLAKFGLQLLGDKFIHSRIFSPQKTSPSVFRCDQAFQGF